MSLQDVASRPWQRCKSQRDQEKVENGSWLPPRGTRYPGGDNLKIALKPLTLEPVCSCSQKEVLRRRLWKSQRSRWSTSQHLLGPCPNNCKPPHDTEINIKDFDNLDKYFEQKSLILLMFKGTIFCSLSCSICLNFYSCKLMGKIGKSVNNQ